MKKIALFLVFILSISFQIKSQTYKPKWGPICEEEGSLLRNGGLLGIQGDYYYLFMNLQSEDKLLKYDMNHKLISNEALDLKFDNQQIRLKMLINTKNGSFGYFDSTDEEKQQMTAFSAKFTDGKFSDSKQIYKHDYNFKFAISLYGYSNKYSYNDNHGIILCRDLSHFVYTNIPTFESNSQQKLAIAVFDADMNLLWDKMQSFEYLNKDLEIRQICINNSGVVYLSCRLEKDKSAKKKAYIDFDYKIFRITKDDIKEFDVNIGELIFPTDALLYLTEDMNSEFILSGFYSDGYMKFGLRGLFYLSGNNKDGISIIKTHKFDASFLKDNITDEDLKKGRGLSWDYKTHRFIPFKDGSIGLLTEETSSASTSSRGSSMGYTYYNSNNILIPRFTSDGELSNIIKIPKYFASSTPFSLSYSFASINNKTYLLFNNSKDSGSAFDLSGGRVELVIINELGEIEYNKPLFKNDEVELLYAPKLFDYTNDKLLIGNLGSLTNKYSFGIIDLK